MPKELTGLSKVIHEERYAHDNETWADTCKRVADYVSMAENGDKAEWAEAFRVLMEDQAFIPGGRILANAGRVGGQLLNCFVLPVEDNRESIGDLIKEVLIVSGTGGGIGISFKNLRYRGAKIVRAGGTSSGSVSFMNVVDAVAATIKTGGGRRAALMLSLPVDHPDIEEFLKHKLDLNNLNNANVSVEINNDFIDAVKRNKDWDLVWAGQVVKTVKARKLWNKVCKNAVKCGEPGILNLELMEEKSNSYYYAKILATNPCVTGETTILTDKGHVRIDSVVDQRVNVWNGKEWSKVTPRVTGEDQEIIDVEFSDGSGLACTPYHSFPIVKGVDARHPRVTKVQAKDLQIGDKIDKWELPVITGNTELREAYSKGAFAGDGYMRRGDTPVIDLHGVKRDLMPYLDVKTHNEGPSCKAHNKINVTLDSLRRKGGMTDYCKTFVPDNTYTVQSRLDWLAGYLDTDGTQQNGAASMSSVNREFLLELKKMLMTLGVQSTISLSHPAMVRAMPDGRGGMKDYRTQACYRITFGSGYVAHLLNLGLTCHRLDFSKAIGRRVRANAVRITKLTPRTKREAKVYCFNEPKRHIGTFGCVSIGNCGEQPLPAYSACCLGSVNINNFVKNGRIEEAPFKRAIATAIRFLDDVLTVNTYPLDAIKSTVTAERRIGLGLMGIHSAMLQMGIKYSSREGLEFIEWVYKTLRDESYKASCALAAEKGAFGLFEVEAFLDSGFVKGLPIGVKRKIRESGMRNVTVNTAAPTGTTAMLCGVSSGIEPIFAPVYKRTFFSDKADDGGRKSEIVVDVEVQNALESGKSFDELEHFEGAYDVPVEQHFRVQETVQRCLDSATSKTINVPKGFDYQELERLMLKYAKTLKGTTVYMAGSRAHEPLQPVEFTEANLKKAIRKAEREAREDCADGTCEV